MCPAVSPSFIWRCVRATGLHVGRHTEQGLWAANGHDCGETDRISTAGSAGARASEHAVADREGVMKLWRPRVAIGGTMPSARCHGPNWPDRDGLAGSRSRKVL